MSRKMLPGLCYLDSWEKRKHPFLTWPAILVNPEPHSHLFNVECGRFATEVILEMRTEKGSKLPQKSKGLTKSI